MPLVLTQKLAGSKYAGEIGRVYRYPRQPWGTRVRVRPGDRFVYYRPGEAGAGKCYFGMGVVGSVGPDDDEPGIIRVQLLDYHPFDPPVPYRLPNGDYIESGGNPQPMFQWSLRVITTEDLTRIEEYAKALVETGLRHGSRE